MSFQWQAFDWQVVGLGLGKALLFYAGLSLIQWVLGRAQVLRKSAVALNLGFLSLSILLFLSPYLDAIHIHLRNAVLAAFIFFSICVLLRLMDSLLFGLIFRLRRRKTVPVVLRGYRAVAGFPGGAVFDHPHHVSQRQHECAGAVIPCRGLHCR